MTTVIPDVLAKVYPNMDKETYEQLRYNPKFYTKSIKIC